MRWERFFENLEQQLDSEWEAERAALDTEAERLRIARLPLSHRVLRLAADGAEAPIEVSVEVRPDITLRGWMTGAGADWLTVDSRRRHGAALIPHAAILALGLAPTDLLRSARASAGGSSVAARISFGFVLRDLARRRQAVRVHTDQGAVMSGTIDRAGADHLDLALHEPDAPRRPSAVSGHRTVPFAAIAWVGFDAPPA
ncbi:hypothetical protein [Microbacterium radiodurans]|uniref:Uncharacterized protein n=1 Tax=Microbacterium radiodurans TaxID=661398 RepID=A0A5J5IR36_9MICO|nr:hypothetical protein [Microbacterium radiodurans]KAA9085120.1 hypothetical protein F6B42_11500 [Microbacterium radiodurans]